MREPLGLLLEFFLLASYPECGNLGSADDQFDLRLIEAMIPHFEGGIDMAQQALQNSDRPEMKQLAQAIIDSQQ